MGYSELQRRADIVARHRENRGRLASAYTTVVTTGIGVVEFDEPIAFGMIFIDRPIPHYASEVDADDLRNAADLEDSDDLPLPMCSGSVTSWDTDDNDHYVGAWVATRVESPESITGVVVTHHFDFHGVALKVVPVDPDD